MPWWCWIGGFLTIWMTNYGIWWTIIPLLMVGSLFLGTLTELYSKAQDPLINFQANLYSDVAAKPGIRKVLEEVNKERKARKVDKRLTGSQVIDESLQEIITYLLRDYIRPWYRKISSDEEFLENVGESLQKIIIKTAAKMKDVPWIMYFTTNFVDDAASHLRLYRLSLNQMKPELEIKKSAPQTLASFKSATESGSAGHSRNNSDGGGKSLTPKTHSRNNSISDKPQDLESIFFRLESEQENNRPHHEQISLNKDGERNYLQDILDIILYQVLSSEDFQCLPARNLVKEIVIGGVFIPLINLLADPDFINRMFVWLCSDVSLTSEAFLTTLRTTNSKDELNATLDIVNKEIAFLQGRDAGGDDDSLVRQQLKSMQYVKKFIESKLQGGSRIKTASNERLEHLPLQKLLTNSVALSYFIDYLSSVDMQNYIFFHLSIDRWKALAQSEKEIGANCEGKAHDEIMRESAQHIYQNFLGEDVPGRVRLNPRAERTLITNLSTQPLPDTCFDEIHNLIQKKLEENCLDDFYRSNIYAKLLAELDLLKEMEQDDEGQSPDTLSLTGSLDDEEPFERKKIPEVGVGKFVLKVEIIDSGVVQDRGKTYGVYALSASKIFQNEFVERWHVYRRYSDFYDLQQKVKEAFSDLGKLPFPGKKTFNNMGALTIAKRMKMLNDYLQILLVTAAAETHPNLTNLLLSFLEPPEYDKAGTLSSAFESVVSPIKHSVKTVTAAVRTMPDNLLNTVDGLSRSLHSARKDSSRLPQDEVPLRIMLLLMDEVFDLQSRNQWLRRRIVVLLRQMFGEIMNRKILDYVEELTGAPRVARYLYSLKEALWPNGAPFTSRPPRDEATKLRTRIVAKTALLSALSDDIKHVLGSDTTRRGLIRVYNTFQHPRLNRRLIYVCLENILELIFPPIKDVHNTIVRNQNKL